LSRSYSDPTAIEDRRTDLQDYLNKVADQNTRDACMHTFLGADDAAFATTKIDLETNERFFNRPVSFLLEDEIQKATYTVLNLLETSELDEAFSSDLMDGCVGIAFVTMLNGGFMFSGRVGTGLVVTRMPNGEWSAPSAIGLAGAGWGLQMGGELVDYMVILSDLAAVESFSSALQVSASTELAISVGTGVAAETSLNLGIDGSGSITIASGQSKGLYFGASFQCSVSGTRPDVNAAFYSKLVDPRDLLSGRAPRPLKAQPLYKALEFMVSKCAAARRPFGRLNDDGIGPILLATSRRCTTPTLLESEAPAMPENEHGTVYDELPKLSSPGDGTAIYALQCDGTLQECDIDSHQGGVLPMALAVGVVAVAASVLTASSSVTAEEGTEAAEDVNEATPGVLSSEEVEEPEYGSLSSGEE
jgi:lipid-binding SYLF domain-containing protein